MLFYTLGQSHVFLAMLACGVACGAWYDFLRRLRMALEAGKVLGALCDLLFGAGLFVMLLTSLFFASRMEVRFYSLMGAACGMVMYLLAVMPALDALMRFLQKITQKIQSFPHIKKIFQILFK